MHRRGVYFCGYKGNQELYERNHTRTSMKMYNTSIVSSKDVAPHGCFRLQQHTGGHYLRVRRHVLDTAAFM